MELLWLVGEEADEDIATPLQLDGESLSPIGWIGFQELPYKESDGTNTVQVGSSVQYSS